MDFTLTDEQQMLREGAERYLQENYPFERRRATAATAASCDDATWAAFAEMGWLALTVPEEAGGLGAGVIEAALLHEALGRRNVLEPVATSAVLCARLIERSGHAAARETVLPAIAGGEARVALACLEPDRYYALVAPSTVARRDGDGYVLSGAKIVVVDAPAAHRFIVSAGVAGESGCALFLVDATAAGLEQRAYPLIDGRRAADLDLRDVRVGADALLCGPAEGAAVLDEALDRFRIVQVADALGAMEAVIDLTAEHIRNRKQFGQPLATFQALQHRMSESFVKVQELRSALYHAFAHVDAPPAERNAAVSAAVVVASEAGRVVGGQGIQLHGGVGMTEEYQVGHYFKRLLVTEKLWGDVDFHLDRIAFNYR